MSARPKLPLLLGLALSHALVFLVAGKIPRSAPGSAAPPPPTGNASPTAEHREHHRSRGIDFPAEWQRLHRSDLSREDFEADRKQLLSQWIRRDLGAVLDLLYGPQTNGWRQSNPIRDLMKREIATRPVEVIEWIRAGRFGSARQELFSLWFSSLSDSGDRLLIISEMNGMTHYERQWSVQALVQRSGLPELRAMREQILKVDREHLYSDTMRDCWATRLIELTWLDPAPTFEQERDPELLWHLGDAWAAKRFGRDPDPSRLAELMTLPEAARPGALESIFNAADERGIAGVLPVLQELGRLRAWNELATDEAAHALLVASERGANESRQVAAWLEQVDDPAVRSKLLPQLALSYRRTDQAGCLDWMRTLPPGADRDAASATLIRRHVGSLGFRKAMLGLVTDAALARELESKHRDLTK